MKDDFIINKKSIFFVFGFLLLIVFMGISKSIIRDESVSLYSTLFTLIFITGITWFLKTKVSKKSFDQVKNTSRSKKVMYTGFFIIFLILLTIGLFPDVVESWIVSVFSFLN